MATWVAVTMHGWWFPGRHVVHALPCAVLAIAWWLDRIARRAALVAWAGVVVGAVSALWLAAEAAFGDVTLVFDPWATTDPVLRRDAAAAARTCATTAIRRRRRATSAGSSLLLAARRPSRVRHEPGDRRRRSVLDDVVAEAVA